MLPSQRAISVAVDYVDYHWRLAPAAGHVIRLVRLVRHFTSLCTTGPSEETCARSTVSVPSRWWKHRHATYGMMSRARPEVLVGA